MMQMRPSSLRHPAEAEFVSTVWQHYHTHGRHDLPWRKTTNPYRILVSEMMLQQTQVVRVIPKYQSFLRQFPNIQALALAPLAEVLLAWQGLGYNRRAKYLKEAATVVHTLRHGRWPRSVDVLVELPGVGPYTAGAVAAFAYNQPVPIIETNIRTVYLRHFFPNVTNVSDAAIMELVRATLDQANPRDWYYALMDYGAYLKQTVGNSNHQSKHYAKQSPFKGSDRAVRGAIMRHVLEAPGSLSVLARQVGVDQEKLRKILASLVRDQLIVKQGNRYYVA